MNTEQAIKILTEICAQVNGTLAMHQQIQMAIRTVQEEIAMLRDAVKTAVPAPETPAA